VRGSQSAAVEHALLPAFVIAGGGALLYLLVNGTAGRAAAWPAAAAAALAIALLLTVRQGDRTAAEVLPRALADWIVVPLPGLLVLYLSFNGGGFSPGNQGLVAFVLALALALRIAIVPSPFAGMTPTGAVAVAALGLYALWTLVSGAWSHAWGRAVTEFDLALVYVLVAALFTTTARSSARLRWMVRGVAAAAIAVCACALITRVLPNVWPIAPNLGENRLSYPLTYWNAFGLLAGIGVILSVYATASTRESPAVMAITAAGVPLTATTLYFTFSRGAIGVTAIALVVLLLVARSRGLLGAAIATVPATAFALHAAYGADKLASPTPTSPAAVAQGHHVAAVLAGCMVVAALARLALIPVDRQVAHFRLPPQYRMGLVRGAWAAAAVVALTVVAAGFASGAVGHEWSRFVNKRKVTATADLRARLSDPSNNHRLDQWKQGMHSFRASPLHGHGAGTYQLEWARRRPDRTSVEDAHSLYVEALSELGVVGFALVVTALLALLVGVARRSRGRNRSLYAAVLAVSVAWVVHAGVDWDWEMPAVSVPFFALGAAALARSARRRPFAPPVLPVRGALAAGVLALGVLPVLVAVSQHHLDASARAGTPAACIRSAQASANALGARAEPYQALAYCEQSSGRNAAALAAIGKAVDRDPDFWRYRYDRALIAAAAGGDPRPDLRRAIALDPREPTLGVALNLFRFRPRARWPATARKAIALGT
jgi:hypothetical protein